MGEGPELGQGDGILPAGAPPSFNEAPSGPRVWAMWMAAEPQRCQAGWDLHPMNKRASAWTPETIWSNLYCSGSPY